MGIDYEKLTEITVKSQAEFDMIPDDFKGRIYVEFGSYFNKAIINRSFVRSVEARGNSSVVARGNSSVVARGNSSVEARGNSSVVAWGNSSVEAWENSSVVAWGNSSVEARGNSSVEAWENSSVEAWENSSVVARGNSSVEASGNVQIVNRLLNGRVEISGNARIVFMPKTIEEFMSFYGIKHDKKKAIFFKAVHHTEYGYVSDYDCNFKYQIGETIHNTCDPDVSDDCSYGIHIAHVAWCLDFGRNWDDLAIIAVETDINNIVLPNETTGKVRTSEIKVLYEVPLDTCGIFGKILAKRKASLH